MNLTNLNVYRMSEDSLYLKLEQAEDTQDQATQDVVNAELDRRLIIKARLQERARKEEQRKTEEFEKCQAQIKAIFNGSDLGRMKLIQLTIGVQFQDDYELDDVSFIVTSSVAHEYQDNVWTFETLKQAEHKLTALIYDRVYTHYFRNATPEKVQELTAVLSEAA